MASSDSFWVLVVDWGGTLFLISGVGHWLQAPLSWFMKNKYISIMCEKSKLSVTEKMNRILQMKVEPHFKNKMEIVLLNGTTLFTSGAKTPEFRQWLDGR